DGVAGEVGAGKGLVHDRDAGGAGAVVLGEFAAGGEGDAEGGEKGGRDGFDVGAHVHAGGRKEALGAGGASGHVVGDGGEGSGRRGERRGGCEDRRRSGGCERPSRS